MLLGDYFTNIFKLAGVDPNSEEAKALLTNTAVSGYDLPDAVINQVNGALLTVDSAKNNPALKNHFTALALNGIDDEINASVSNLGLTPADIEELKGVGSTYKRVTLLAEKAKAAAAAATTPAESADATKQLDALNAEIARLNGDVAAAAAAKETALKEAQAGFNNQLKDMSLTSILGNYEYASGASKEANVLTAKTLLNNALQQGNLNVVRDAAGNLSITTAENTAFYENNQPVSVKDYAEKVLGEHKLLKITNTPAPGAPATPGAAPAQTTVTPTPGVNNSAASVADQLLAEAMGE